MGYVHRLLLLLLLLLSGHASAELKKYAECYQMYFALRYSTEESKAIMARGEKAPPVKVKSFGSSVTHMHAAEKEGYYYEDIAMWFDTVDAKRFRQSLLDTLAGKQKEAPEEKARFLRKWLDQWPKKFISEGVSPPADWGRWSYQRRVEYLASSEANPFELINVDGKNELFYREFLTYDQLVPTKLTPANVSVANDWEGWEIKSTKGIADRARYERWRGFVEEEMEGKVGHQHILHGWPKSAALREEIAPKYIEMIDATSWYLFLRQMNRDPSQVESILFHKYLNLYTRPMLERLEKAFVEGKPAEFKERFRTIGAKNFKALEGQVSDGRSHVPSIEFRSGNKATDLKRNMIKDAVEARLASGDYNDLKDYNEYLFRANVPTRNVITEWLAKAKKVPFDDYSFRFDGMYDAPAIPRQLVKDIDAIEEFERIFQVPPLGVAFNPDSRASNHLHTKLIAPLLPWENRLNLGYKSRILNEARKRYAVSYLAIAKEYVRKYEKVQGDSNAVSELRIDIAAKLEQISYNFFRRTRLDLDFEHYLAPKPRDLPKITVESGTVVNVNRLDLGIEYSFRFGDKPGSKKAAEEQIERAAFKLCEQLPGCMDRGGVARVDDGGHGHGLSIRYLVTDGKGRKWRVEWDGIRRDYDAKNNPVNPRGGHIEAPTPKFAPQDMSEVVHLYQAMSEAGSYPKRIAGGAHLNFDLAPILALKPPEKAGEKLANVIRTFESNARMIRFLWQHPARLRVAAPAPDPVFGKEFTDAINDFKGTPEDLAKLLYDKKYFNPYEGRKPAYVQFNFTGLMHDLAPKKWQKPIDIKKPGQEWFPSFSGKAADRAEVRLNDAPLDPYMAALQIKYYRAMLNKALNGRGRQPLAPVFSEAEFQTWKGDADKFFRAARVHLEELGLDPEEFQPLLIQSWETQNYKPKLEFDRTIFDRFRWGEEGGGNKRRLVEEEEEESYSEFSDRIRKRLGPRAPKPVQDE